jgi:outer membrane protein X
MRRSFPQLLAALTILAAAPAARAEAQNYSPVRVDLTVFAAYAPGDATAWGGGVALEPKYNFTDQLSAGLRLEASAFVVQDVKVGSGTGSTNVQQGARAVTAIAAKGDYYLTTSSVRPFVGLGLGYYRIGAGSQSVSTSGTGTASVVQTAGSYRGFGVAPQLGLNLGGFRLAATYHLLTGGDIVVATQSVGAPAPTQTKIGKNYFAFEIGGTFGGGRRGAN